MPTMKVCPKCESPNWSKEAKVSTHSCQCFNCNSFFLDGEEIEKEMPPSPVISAELFQVDVDLPSGNRYPMDVVLDAIREIKPHMTMNRVLGECDPPSDEMHVRLADASHLVKSLYFQGDILMADLEILYTPKGEALKTYLRAGGQIRVTPRGFGETEEDENGIYVVRKYTLITVDVYQNPEVEEE